MLPEVDECRPGAVRPAVEIDAVVAEERADVVQVVHRDVCCVEPYVGVIPFETPPQPVERDLAPLSQLAQRAGTGPAVQRIGLAGSTLIDQDDVPRALNLAEDDADLAGQLGRGLPGAAGQEEERILAGSRCEGRENDNPKADLHVQ